MVVVTRPPANGFVAFVRRIYNPVGFSKGYNFVLWFIFAGALMGFTLARFMYFDFHGIFCAREQRGQPDGTLPGECYHYQGSASRGRIGIMLHLGGILPASFLVVFQFVPAIRHKLLLFHRINGYVIILLSLVGTAGVLMVADKSFGGSLDIQIAAGLACIIFVSCMAISYYNVKRLQIEQHRAWMLRGWVVAGFIITMRLLTNIMVSVNGALGKVYYEALPCYVVDYLFHGNQTEVLGFYPGCDAFYSGANHEAQALVTGDIAGPDGRIDMLSATFNSTFPAACWLALFIHIFAVELYLRLTPAEGERLRRISYQRQLEAGYRNPGNAGTTVQSLGDAEPWVPPAPSDSVEQKRGGHGFVKQKHGRRSLYRNSN
ncbi:microtubule associated protein [Paramyrothecium foliicola]|nr:microtubule associated protein [Paramyrothecium foliicola]